MKCFKALASLETSFNKKWLFNLFLIFKLYLVHLIRFNFRDNRKEGILSLQNIEN